MGLYGCVGWAEWRSQSRVEGGGEGAVEREGGFQVVPHQEDGGTGGREEQADAIFGGETMLGKASMMAGLWWLVFSCTFYSYSLSNATVGSGSCLEPRLWHPLRCETARHYSC